MRNLIAIFLVAMAGSASAAPKLVVPVTSGDQVGLALQGKARASGGAAALVGMWSDDGALEIGGFDDRSRRADPSTVRAAEIVSGRSIQSRGVRLTGRFYGTKDADRSGWAVSIDARVQRVSDLGAALSGTWRTQGDSRLTLGSKLRF